MSPGDRCDEVIRLIDRVLAGSERETGSEIDPEPAREDSTALESEGIGVEEPPGHWGVYYLRPSA